MPDHAVKRLVEEVATAEDYALVLAVCSAGLERHKREAAPRPGWDGGAALVVEAQLLEEIRLFTIVGSLSKRLLAEALR